MDWTAALRVPVLETARLRLRGHRVDDYEALAAMWADPLVVRYLGRQPSTREVSWQRLLRYPGLWALLGYGYWAVEETASGRCIGDIGYADFHRDIDPSFDGTPELGWVLAAHAHGKGYASEALQAVLAWGDAHFGPHRAACVIEPENVASLRLAARHGFVAERETRYHGEILRMLARDTRA